MWGGVSEVCSGSYRLEGRDYNLCVFSGSFFPSHPTQNSRESFDHEVWTTDYSDERDLKNKRTNQGKY